MNRAAYALILFALAAVSGPVRAHDAAPDALLAQADLRQQMIDKCLRNNGTDCEREVDTELQAEGIEHPPVITPGMDLDQASPALAARRQQMIDDCEQNNGVDCATQVDTELEAEGSLTGGHTNHNARPDGTGKRVQ